jgi:hypothetical protein
MSIDFNNPVYSKNIIEFITVASEYCGFVEKTEKFSKIDFISKSQKILTLMYLKASLIEKFNKDDIEEGNIEKFVTEVDYNFVIEAVSGKLGSLEQFIDIFEPTRTEISEAVQVSLSECFADIYQDLKDFISNYQIGNENIMTEAIFECQLNFEIFWGPRILALLNTIHNILYSDNDLEDDNISNSKSNKKNKASNIFDDYNDEFNSDSLEDIFR